MPIYAKKICDMRTLLKYAKKYGNKRNMRQSHIRVKLPSLLANGTMAHTQFGSVALK